MNKEAPKKKRSSNWTEQEKKILHMLVMERADIIENKDTSSITNKAKKLAWEEVLACYNSINVRKRDIANLLNQWRNMKNRNKKNQLACNSEYTQSSGSPLSFPPPPEDMNEELDEVIPQDFIALVNDDNSDCTDKKYQPDYNQDYSRIQDSERTTVKRGRLHDGCKCNEGHDHQLFILAKTAREAAMKREEEEHQQKMIVMALEQEYLSLKIKKIKSELNNS